MKFKSFKKIVKICLTIKIKFLARKFFCIKILFWNPYFSPLKTFMRKGKNPDRDPYLWLTDPDAFKKCLISAEKNVVLMQYLITVKYFFITLYKCVNTKHVVLVTKYSYLHRTVYMSTKIMQFQICSIVLLFLLSLLTGSSVIIWGQCCNAALLNFTHEFGKRVKCFALS